MRSFRYFALVALTLVGLNMAGFAAAQSGDWVGKTVFTKKSGIKIGQADDRGRQVELATLTGIHYQVLAERDGWIKVKARNGVTGWFDKNDAVVLEDAVGYFTDRIRENPKGSGAFQSRAHAWSLKGDVDIAIKDIDEALRLDPRSHIFNSRGNLLRAKMEYEKAIADFTEAIRLDPKESIYYSNRGTTWHAKKDFDKAITDFGEAIRLDPNYAWAHYGRARAWTKKKEYAKAIADYNEVRRLDPACAATMNNLAWMLATCPDARIRDGKRAVVLAHEAVKLDKTNGNYLDTLAAAYAEVGNFEEAVRWQERALQDPEYANNEEVRHHLELYRKKLPHREE